MCERERPLSHTPMLIHEMVSCRTSRSSCTFTLQQFEVANTVNRLKVGLGISRTNADSQWNPVYNAFHRNFCCGNETIRR